MFKYTASKNNRSQLGKHAPASKPQLGYKTEARSQAALKCYRK